MKILPNPQRRTPNAERRTPNAERQTPNAERQTPNAKRQTPNPTPAANASDGRLKDERGDGGRFLRRCDRY
jgi:hypothetical protein